MTSSAIAASKVRPPRLRASCDGCFVAKVKCSKARPICSRCLACGIECRYSPSSRAGKPSKSLTAAAAAAAAAERRRSSKHSVPSPLTDDGSGCFTWSLNAGAPAGASAAWAVATPPCTGVEGTFSTIAVATPAPTAVDGTFSPLAVMGLADDVPCDATPMPAADMYAAGLPWTPPDLSGASLFVDPSTVPALAPQLARTHSMGMAMAPSPADTIWDGGVDPADIMALVPPQQPQPLPRSQSASTPAGMTPPYFLPSPAATPTQLSRTATAPAGQDLKCVDQPGRHRKSLSQPSIAGVPTVSSCMCFTVCLQALQALHNVSASGPTAPLDRVLALNGRAVEGCAAMLACPRCMSRPGLHTSAMLLSTVIGKITSSYASASQAHFDAADSMASPVSPAAASDNGMAGRWLEMEILSRELRRLEEVYDRFTEIFCDDPEVGGAMFGMIGYLGQKLRSTLEGVVSYRTFCAPINVAC